MYGVKHDGDEKDTYKDETWVLAVQAEAGQSELFRFYQSSLPIREFQVRYRGALWNLGYSEQELWGQTAIALVSNKRSSFVRVIQGPVGKCLRKTRLV